MKLVLIIIMSLAAAVDISACSSVVLKNGNEVFLAKNFDWTYGNGYLIKNLRNTKKQAFYTQSGKPVSWISIYGSVTFNQNGKEMPYGGINEKGLTVEMLWLEFTNYGATAEREFLNELEWIQYQLDNYTSVDEVLANLRKIAINPVKGKIHYIVADPTGKSVVIEFLNGEAVVTNKAGNECQAITNYPAGVSQQNYSKQPAKLKGNNTSHLHRYNVLQRNIENQVFNKPALSVTDGFKALEEVAIVKGSFRTYWSLVYDLNNKVVHFKTSANNLLRYVSLQQLDFDHELLGLDINAALQGEVTGSLASYTPRAKCKAHQTSFAGLGLNQVDAQEWSDHQFNLTGTEDNSYTKQYSYAENGFQIC
jgi:penicillin V acylase-like amidase (Ntn superfamily)